MNLEDVKGKLQIKIAVLNDELKEVTNKINISEEILNYENLEKSYIHFKLEYLRKNMNMIYQKSIMSS